MTQRYFRRLEINYIEQHPFTYSHFHHSIIHCSNFEYRINFKTYTEEPIHWVKCRGELFGQQKFNLPNSPNSEHFVLSEKPVPHKF